MVQRVVLSNNYQYLNEELLNNLVNNVLNIIEGDINNIDNSSSNNTNNSVSNETRRANSNSQSASSVNSSPISNIPNNTSLLKDLIKILVIKELITKQNIRRFPGNPMIHTPYYQMPIMNSPYMVN